MVDTTPDHIIFIWRSQVCAPDCVQFGLLVEHTLQGVPTDRELAAEGRSEDRPLHSKSVGAARCRFRAAPFDKGSEVDET
jgi:hypothetical protein